MPCVRSLLVLLAGLVSTAPPCAEAGGAITRTFPVGPAPQTQWRIHWDIVRHGGGTGSETLVIREAHFRRAPNDPELQILGDCRLAEMFVPYNGGAPRFYDMDYGMTMVDLQPKDLGPGCVGTPEIFDRSGAMATTGPLAVEVHDGHLRWMDRWNATRRGESVTLWSALDAANYRYLMVYEFRDDGVISVRVGATAHNLLSSDADTATHMHLACWRLNIVLGDQTMNDISVVTWETSPGSTTALTKSTTFNGGYEGGIAWNPEEFTRLRIQSQCVKNSHDPAHRIGYELIPHRQGNARHYGVGEEFTHHDLWVTRSQFPPEWHPEDLPDHVRAPESIESGAAVIWHMAPVLHAPRDEDFGPVGPDDTAGVALTAWSGFELKPRNLFAKTPLYP